MFHLIECERRVEAAAFIAALSRFLNSPRANAFVSPDDLVEVWSVPSVSGNAVTLYLTDAAHVAAELAFSPVPVTRVCAADEIPRDAIRVLDGRAHRAMGLDEAEQCLTSDQHGDSSGAP